MKKNILWLGVILSFASWAVFPDVVIITNPDTQLTTLNKKDIQDIFTGKKTRWNGEGKIIVATLEDSELHREFVRTFLKKTPAQFKNYWREKVFSGEGLLPKTFKDEQSLIEFVSGTKGAVGYVSSPTTPGTKPIKIITVSDK